MYNNTFYKKQRSTTPKEKDLQLPGSGQTARQQSYKQTPAGYGGATNTSTYKSPSTGGYTSSTTGYKNNANSGYNSYNTGNTGGYTNSVDYGNAVAPVKPVGTVNPSMSTYKQPAAYPSANLPSAYSANTRYNTPANAAGNTALRSLSAAYKPAAQSPVSATNRLSGYSAPGKIPSPSLQSTYPSASLPARQTTQQKQQNIVNPLDNFAKHDKIKTETAPQKNYAAYQTAQAAQPAALTQKQRDAVHKQADTLDQLRILMQNRDTPPSEAYKKEMRALYSPDEWKVISGEMPANLWEKKQLQRPYKDLSVARAAGLLTDDGEGNQDDSDKNSISSMFTPLAKKEAAVAEKRTQPFQESQYNDPNRQQLIENQARNLSHLRQLMSESRYDTNLQRELWQTYQDYPEQWEVIMGRKSPEEWVRWQTQDDKFEAFKEHRQELQRRQSWDKKVAEWPVEVSIKHVDSEGNVLTEERRYPGEQQGTYRAEGQPEMVPGFTEDDVPIFAEGTILPEIEVGGRKRETALLDLSEEDQRMIHEMCMVAGVDYYLVLGLIAHESGSDPTKKNADSDASGWMQVLPQYWDDYTVKGREYTDGAIEQQLRAIADAAAAKAGDAANFSDMFNKYANAAVGISMLYEFQLLNGEKPSMYRVLNAYGGGGPATLEILYYRDLLAMQDGQKPWYEGIYYAANGKMRRPRIKSEFVEEY